MGKVDELHMDFEYTREQEEFRREVRDWYEENLPDGWLDGQRNLPDEEKEREEFLLDWQRKLYEGGWAAIHWPEEYGGRGATLMEQLIYQQETARVDPPPKINIIGIDLVGPTIEAVGTEAQKDRFLRKILSGEEIWCQGYSEPNAGSDLASLQCEAVDEGDHFRINGQKIWTTHAHRADWCYLLTRTDDSGRKHHGITALMVDMSQDGITTERIHQISDERGFNQVYFDDATATKDHVLGEVDDGWRVAMKQLAFERIALSQSLSIEQRLEELIEYCKTTTRNGEPLTEDPQIRQKLAEFDTRVQAAKLTSFRNVSKQMKTGEAGPEVSFGKLYDSELNADLQRFRLKLLGPEGSLWGDDSRGGEWATRYISNFGTRIGGGTSDIQRNIIGEQVLGLPKGTQQ